MVNRAIDFRFLVFKITVFETVPDRFSISKRFNRGAAAAYNTHVNPVVIIRYSFIPGRGLTESAVPATIYLRAISFRTRTGDPLSTFDSSRNYCEINSDFCV